MPYSGGNRGEEVDDYHDYGRSGRQGTQGYGQNGYGHGGYGGQAGGGYGQGGYGHTGGGANYGQGHGGGGGYGRTGVGGYGTYGSANEESYGIEHQGWTRIRGCRSQTQHFSVKIPVTVFFCLRACSNLHISDIPKIKEDPSLLALPLAKDKRRPSVSLFAPLLTPSKDISVAHQEKNSAHDLRYEAISCALNLNDRHP